MVQQSKPTTQSFLQATHSYAALQCRITVNSVQSASGMN